MAKLGYAKYLVWKLGTRMPKAGLYQLQGILNFLRLGRWMRDHGFHFDRLVRDRWEVFDAVISRVQDKRVLYLEFGVFRGRTIRYWSTKLRNPDTRLHGFDSFEGLPEAWGPHTKGTFSVSGKLPEIADPRVKFFKGWFDRVLPDYVVPEHDVLVLIMDADMYTSTAYVLNHLRSYIRPGTFIYFDEINHVEDEAKAFHEFMEATSLKFIPVCADRSLTRAVFECVG
jgi:macrocin-O-methyltransferase TylF-like protien